jgi:hypothetical protein
MLCAGRATPVAVALATIEERAMNVREFCDDDAGYLAWLANHPDGYVINLARNRRPTDALTHHAGCRTISGQIPRGHAWTKSYVKVCAEHLAKFEQWATDTFGQPITHCKTCCPSHHIG